jgi:predicted RNA methylase/outer membrane protein OmpA-like peptidoglycan-associated protein
MFAIGAQMLGSGYTVGMEIDPKALAIAVQNVEECEVEVDLMLCNVALLECQGKQFDTVLMNPPFGTRVKGIDMIFLDKALSMATGAVYSMHKSSTRDHILKVAKEKWDVEAQVCAQLKFEVPAMYKFHRQKSMDIEVDMIRFAHRRPRHPDGSFIGAPKAAPKQAISCSEVREIWARVVQVDGERSASSTGTVSGLAGESGAALAAGAAEEAKRQARQAAEEAKRPEIDQDKEKWDLAAAGGGSSGAGTGEEVGEDEEEDEPGLFECENECGFMGTFEECEAHEGICTATPPPDSDDDDADALDEIDKAAAAMSIASAAPPEPPSQNSDSSAAAPQVTQVGSTNEHDAAATSADRASATATATASATATATATASNRSSDHDAGTDEDAGSVDDGITNGDVAKRSVATGAAAGGDEDEDDEDDESEESEESDESEESEDDSSDEDIFLGMGRGGAMAVSVEEWDPMVIVRRMREEEARAREEQAWVAGGEEAEPSGVNKGCSATVGVIDSGGESKEAEEEKQEEEKEEEQQQQQEEEQQQEQQQEQQEEQQQEQQQQLLSSASSAEEVLVCAVVCAGADEAVISDDTLFSTSDDALFSTSDDTLFGTSSSAFSDGGDGHVGDIAGTTTPSHAPCHTSLTSLHFAGTSLLSVFESPRHASLITPAQSAQVGTMGLSAAAAAASAKERADEEARGFVGGMGGMEGVGATLLAEEAAATGAALAVTGAASAATGTTAVAIEPGAGAVPTPAPEGAAVEGAAANATEPAALSEKATPAPAGVAAASRPLPEKKAAAGPVAIERGWLDRWGQELETQMARAAAAGVVEAAANAGTVEAGEDEGKVEAGVEVERV